MPWDDQDSSRWEAYRARIQKRIEEIFEELGRSEGQGSRILGRVAGVLGIEGRREAQWVLMDYGDFVGHVFIEDMRAYYDLERLWSDAPRVSWDDAREVAAVSGLGG